MTPLEMSPNTSPDAISKEDELSIKDYKPGVEESSTEEEPDEHPAEIETGRGSAAARKPRGLECRGHIVATGHWRQRRTTSSSRSKST